VAYRQLTAAYRVGPGRDDHVNRLAGLDDDAFADRDFGEFRCQPLPSRERAQFGRRDPGRGHHLLQEPAVPGTLLLQAVRTADLLHLPQASPGRLGDVVLEVYANKSVDSVNRSVP
jgi:hypothetical protein